MLEHPALLLRSRSRIAGLGMLPGASPVPGAAPDGKLPAADGQLPKASAGVSSGLALLELSGVDPEMRVKIRHRVAERWADIQGPQVGLGFRAGRVLCCCGKLASTVIVQFLVLCRGEGHMSPRGWAVGLHSRAAMAPTATRTQFRDHAMTGSSWCRGGCICIRLFKRISTHGASHTFS